MKRMAAMSTVVALMVVMLAMSVAPALATPRLSYLCTGGPFGGDTYTVAKYKNYYEGLGYECVKLPKE